MDVKLLIDAIMRQTTVLIAQLSTSVGIRAPLAHVADQVFVDLASEIEAQGVGRKVAADMFGLALRSYQKKMQRLTASATFREKTLWEGVLDFLTQHGGATRERLEARFRYDSERDLAAVLNDLVSQGLVYSTGRGTTAVYGISSEADRSRVAQRDRTESVQSMLWLALYRRPMSRAEVATSLALEPALVETALDALIQDGRLREEDGRLRAETFLVPVGSERGWEAAVFDHFSAVARAIAGKIRRGAPRSEADDEVGGATLTFEIHPGHPHEREVLALLARVRRDVNDLWARVQAENDRIDAASDGGASHAKQRVTFYFGQNVEDIDDSGRGERE
jgi:hypothetical protein